MTVLPLSGSPPVQLRSLLISTSGLWFTGFGLLGTLGGSFSSPEL